jgi:hypothetical protein
MSQNMTYFTFRNLLKKPVIISFYREKGESSIMQTLKSTSEIQELLRKAEIDFDSAVNAALNAYLPKLLMSCPFTEQICSKKQCNNCDCSNLK